MAPSGGAVAGRGLVPPQETTCATRSPTPECEAPASPDATLADLAITLAGALVSGP